MDGWMLNNREISLIFWLAVLFTLSKAWRGVGQVVRALLHPILLATLGLFGLWIWGEVRLGQALDLWDPGLAKDTVVWGLVSGTVLWANSAEAIRNEHFFLSAVTRVLGATFLIEVLTGTFVFSLWVEIPLVPIASLFVLLPLAAKTPDQQSVAKLAGYMTSVIGFGILGHIVLTIVRQWDTLDRGELARTIGLPIWLTIAALPLIFIFGLWVTYDSAFRLMSWRAKGEGDDWRRRWRARLLLVWSFNVRAHDLYLFSGRWQMQLGAAESLHEARAVFREFEISERQRVKDEAQAAIDEETYQRHLIEMAGVDGADASGRRLDQREFRETAAALRWLGNCHMGWYRHDDRYVSDLADRILNPDVGTEGLPAEHGVHSHVSQDGQSWFAWRRTVGGWAFAVGAAGPPPSHWEFDGAAPPSGYPPSGGAWRNTALKESGPNWPDPSE
jgi:hypothetical protein